MARRSASPGRSGEADGPIGTASSHASRSTKEPDVEIDLRDAPGAAEVAPRPDDAAMRLASYLALPTTAPEILLEALLAVADAGQTIGDLVPSGAHTDHWVALLDHFAATKGRRAYIGSFRVAVAQAAELCRTVPEEQRGIAALLLLDRATADATTEDELRHGVVTAMRVRPGTIVPETAIETIVRFALRHHRPDRQLSVELAVPVALDLMSQSKEGCFHPRDIWTLRAAVAVLTNEQRDRVMGRAKGLNREDRKVVEALLRPTQPARGGLFQRRRT